MKSHEQAHGEGDMESSAASGLCPGEPYGLIRSFNSSNESEGFGDEGRASGRTCCLGGIPARM